MSREQAGAVCLIMDGRRYFKWSFRKTVHLPCVLEKCYFESFGLDSDISQLAFQRGK